ncbi:MFS transporter [Iamia sp. SCSIO 61187]|uniref:MFS transporter n=1 Tax=Iamia sp. SCSIO 61187 TaxID=2722752 RepID=UPI001C63A200|nr:MFS transporter [Iamia sp. SCSIO 61187]QYG92743.1 MFS transporter [Iamia sp. SCSIO 61187]
MAATTTDPAAGVPERGGGLRGWAARITGGGPVLPLVVLFGLNAVDELDRTAFGILLPEIRDEFGLGTQGILTLIAVVTLLALVLQVPIAAAADRYPRVPLAAAGGALWGVFSLLTGLATGVVFLFVVRIFSGIGRATVDPTHNSLLADYYAPEARARVFSTHRAANAVGACIGPLSAGLLASAFGWRAPFLVFVVPTAIFVGLALWLKEPVRGGHERRAMGATEEVIATEEVSPSFGEGWRMVWKIETLRRIWYSLPFLGASLIGFVSLASLMYEEQFDLDEKARGFVAAGVEPAQLLGVILGARVATRLMAKDTSLVMRFLSLVAFVVSGALLAFALAPSLAVAIIANLVIAGSLAVLGPGILASLSLAIPPRARSIGFSVGALWVVPGLLFLPILGAVADRWGIRWGMVLMVPIFLVGGLIIATAGASVNRDIAQVWKASAARAEAAHERAAGRSKLLLVRDLEVGYGDVQVLFGVDVEIGEGEIVALLGTNGAGKSTLLKAISGIVEADGGAVIFDGRDITHAPPHEIASLGVAQMPGGAGVFGDLTVRENLQMGSWGHRSDRAATKAGVDEVLGFFPVLGQRLDDPASDLSGGQQQMLALGMAFLSQPRLLMIDELSLGLAPVIVEQLLPIVEGIAASGTTVVIVEQSVNVALTVAETAFFMEKGQIRFHGPTAELLERPDVLRSVFLEGAGAATQARDGDGTAPRPAGAAVAIEKIAERTEEEVTHVAAAGVEGHSADEHVAATAGAAEVALATHDLSVRFGGIKAVDGVTLEVAPGEVVGIIGPNGAGKTTLFDLISGFTPSDGGRVEVRGRDVTRLSASARARAGLGRSFQDARLFPALTVEEAIAVALERWVEVRDPLSAALHLPASFDSEEAVRTRVDALIELLGLEAFRSKFVRELSTGSRRVVDLACVVAHRPTVVLLDEPSSGIAQRETEALAPLLRRIADEVGAGVVVIEHDMPLITAVSDRLVAMDQGSVIAVGAPDEVLHDPAVVASYLGTTASVIARSGDLVAP